MKNCALLLVFMFSSFSAGDAFSQTRVKILSYNVYNGFQSNPVIEKQYTDWVSKIDPDIVAYQEMNKFTQERIEKFAQQYGHAHAVLSKTEGYPVALSSKYPIENVQKITDKMTHVYLYATINNTHVFVVHLSPFSYAKRAAELRLVLAHAASLPQEEHILIMGDFNALDSRDSSQYGEELLNNMQARDKKHDQTNLNDGALDYSVMDQLSSAGYKDTYWAVNDRYQYSLPTKKYLTRATRRIDYIWANAALEKNDIKKAVIIHDADTEVISDHYPVYLEFIQR